jgi:predicted small secreted protein
MKKTIYTLLIILSFTLSACGGSSNTTNGDSSDESSLVATNSTPASGNGTFEITSITNENAGGDGTLQRITILGTIDGEEREVKIYFTIADGSIHNISYSWDDVTTSPPFCGVDCVGFTHDETTRTITLENTGLESFDEANASTLDGTIVYPEEE